MKLFILTGTSRGLGEALAMQLLAPDHHLICLSRTQNEALTARAAAIAAPLEQVACDLADIEQLDRIMPDLFSRLDTIAFTAVHLIHNAGVVQPIAPAHRSDSGSVIQNVHVNLLAPMILTVGFIHAVSHLPCDKRVLMVSSGAARKPYAGWSSYCSAKAGLDHYARCIAAEQAALPHGVKIMSIAPGVIDTGMQAEIRASRVEDFAQRERFVQLKAAGQLLTPHAAASALLAMLSRSDFGTGDPIADIRDQ